MRLAVIAGLFVAAAAAIPTGGVLSGSRGGPAPAADEDAALLEAFPRLDRQVVARGRASRTVGTKVGSLDLKTTAGGELPLTAVGRPIILTFVEPDCTPCAEEIDKLAVMSTVFSQDVYVAVAARPREGRAVEQMLEDRGAGGGLILAGEDSDGAVAKRVGVTRRPSTVIASEEGIIDALWSEPVPLNVYYRFLNEAYGLERGG